MAQRTLLGPLRPLCPFQNQSFLTETACSFSTASASVYTRTQTTRFCIGRDKEINHLTIINFRRHVLARGGCSFPQGFLALWPRILQDSTTSFPFGSRPMAHTGATALCVTLSLRSVLALYSLNHYHSEQGLLTVTVRSPITTEHNQQAD